MNAWAHTGFDVAASRREKRAAAAGGRVNNPHTLKRHISIACGKPRFAAQPLSDLRIEETSAPERSRPDADVTRELGTAGAGTTRPTTPSMPSCSGRRVAMPSGERNRSGDCARRMPGGPVADASSTLAGSIVHTGP